MKELKKIIKYLLPPARLYSGCCIVLLFLLEAVTACKKTPTTQSTKGDTYFKIYTTQVNYISNGHYSGTLGWNGGMGLDASGAIYLSYFDSSLMRYNLIKTDKYGNLCWRKKLHNRGNGFFSLGGYMYQTDNNSYSWPADSNNSLLRTDTSGNIISGIYFQDIDTIFQQTLQNYFTYNNFSNDFLNAGSAYKPDPLFPAAYANLDPFVSLVNPNMGVAWMKTDFIDRTVLSNANYYVFIPHHSVQHPDNGFTAAYRFYKNVIITTANAVDSVYVCLYHFNYQGQLLKQKNLLTGYYWSGGAAVGGSPGFYSKSYINGFQTAGDKMGNIVIAGTKQYASVFSPAVSSSIQLWKFNPVLEIIDSAEIIIGYGIQLTQIIQKDDGNYLVVAFTGTPNGFVLPQQYYLIDINPDMTTKSITKFAPESKQATITNIAATGDGHTILAGIIQTNSSIQDLFILKMNMDEKY